MQKCKKQTVHKVEQEIDEYTEEDRKIDMLNIDFINSNAKSPGITAILNKKPCDLWHS